MMRLSSFPLAVVAATVLAGCATQVQEAASADFTPVYPLAAELQPVGFATGTIYTPQQAGLFATDRRAGRVGDILTVAFSESFQATKSQNAGSAKSSSFEIELPSVLPFASVGPELSNGTTQTFTGNGTAAQSNSLTGQVSVHVVRVLPGGNLEILGQKKLTLNNGDEYIRVRGIVRPEDITSNNVVQSDRIANAEITYIGAGDLADTGQQGWLSRILTSVSPI
ncbi:flagellar basal body L-ring protein FlgH [Roseicyclus sp.]|uniref:flagellar basal body L-ring protein FlgH n=1 Tax=Roseicyclus sp. TaxID=1914329 RepID=UPI003F6C5E47